MQVTPPANEAFSPGGGRWQSKYALAYELLTHPSTVEEGTAHYPDFQCRK